MESHNKSKVFRDYWEGLGSPEEDNWLENEVSDLGQDASYFDLVRDFKSMSLSPDIEAKILQTLPPEENSRVSWWKIAAAALVLLGVGLTTLTKNYPVNENGLTVEEQRDLDMTREALFLMSSKFNEGLSFTYHLGEFDKTINTLSE